MVTPSARGLSEARADRFVREVLLELSRHADPERQAVADWYFPTAMRVLGVRAPALRRVVRAHRTELRDEPPEVAIALAQALVDSNVMEARQVAYELVESHPTALDRISRAEVEALGRGIDNWASVDGFSCCVAGRAWLRGRIRDSTVRRWARSRDRWWRRAALASTVPLNVASRGGRGDPARTLMICELLAADPDDMVVKALSWALRSLAAHDEAAVRSFLDRHRDAIAARVKREVGNKLHTGRKSG